MGRLCLEMLTANQKVPQFVLRLQEGKFFIVWFNTQTKLNHSERSQRTAKTEENREISCRS